MAAAQVHAIPELLENILIHADLIHLFAIKRTNKTFNAVIADSKSLRCRMLVESTGHQDEKRLRVFLARKEVQQAIHPFTIGRPCKIGPRCTTTLYLPCRYMKKNKTRPPKHILTNPMPTTSWCGIRFGNVQRLYVECHQDITLGEKYQVPKNVVSLGQIVDLAEAAVLKEWYDAHHNICEGLVGYGYDELSLSPTNSIQNDKYASFSDDDSDANLSEEGEDASHSQDGEESSLWWVDESARFGQDDGDVSFWENDDAAKCAIPSLL